MIRFFYSLLILALIPLMRWRLTKRGRVEPGYLLLVNERFGRYSQPVDSGFIWVHAVSLGETRAAAVLIARLRKRLPGMRLLLTNGTATGRAEGAKLLQSGDIQTWQPLDTPGTVQRFLAQFKPRIGILMETELWPNLTAGCHQAAVPLVLANARLSPKSQQQALRLAWLARPAYRSLTAVWAQTPDDAARLGALGAPVKGTFGNLKFDATPDAELLARGRAWRASLTRPVAVLASSRDGEEAALLKILSALQDQGAVNEENRPYSSAVDAIQWLLVPRHPQRFDEVAALIEAHGFTVVRRSAWGNAAPVDADTDAKLPAPALERTCPVVWLGDSLGEMALYYGLADVALLGGSFEPLGGQNLIEAAACACPLVMGPHTFNFAEVAELAELAGAALRVPSLKQAVAAVCTLADEPSTRRAMADAAAEFSGAHRGAVEKTVAAVLALLGQKGVDRQ